MNDHQPPVEAAVEEVLGARIVAWVLGEASAFEVAELERICREDASVREYHRRMRHLHEMLGQVEATAGDGSWTLPPEKRQVLESRFGAAGAKPVVRSGSFANRSARRALFGIAACLLVTLVVMRLLPGDKRAGIELLRYEGSTVMEKSAVAQSPASADFEADYGDGWGGGEAAPGTLFSRSFGATPPPAPPAEPAQASLKAANNAASAPVLTPLRFARSDAESGREGRDRGMPAQGQADKSEFETRTAGLSLDLGPENPDRSPAPPSASNSGIAGIVTEGLRSGDEAIGRSNIDALLNHPERRETLGRDGAKDQLPQFEVAAPEFANRLAETSTASADEQAEALGEEIATGPEPAAAAAPEPLLLGLERQERRRSSEIAGEPAEDPLRTNPALTSEHHEARGLSVPRDKESDETLEKGAEMEPEMEPENPAFARDAIAARQAAVVEEPETSPEEAPFSTFSLNISDASFQIAAAAVERGERPDPAQVKPEQFYNAVDYGDPAPIASEPVAGLVEQSSHPVVPNSNLVRIALRTAAAGRAASQPLRLTLVVDQSGSMLREDRRAALQSAGRQLGSLLGERDLVNVVGFSRTPRLIAEGIRGDQGGKLGEALGQPADEGGTNLEEALKLAHEIAFRHYDPQAQNRVVLLTDGAANLGDADPQSLSERVVAMRQNDLSLDVAGIGIDGLHDRLLGGIARHGNGRYHLLAATDHDGNGDAFASQLAGAFRPAAKNVKVQVVFNPARVSGYKLIGFQEDLLRPEDFRNDAVDAAELAAEEAGVALYQVRTDPEGSGDIGSVSVRFEEAASGEMVERSWIIPYEPAAPAFDRAPPSMQLAGLAMLAAESLRGGEMAAMIDFKTLAGPKAVVRSHYGNSRPVARMLSMLDALE